MSHPAPHTTVARRLRRGLAGCLVAGSLLVVGAPALAHDHDSTRSGHPLRLVAYIVHPVGVILDTLILKPLHWIGSHEPIQTLIGHEDD